MLCLLIFLILLQEFKYTLRSRRCRLKHIGYLRDLLDRLGKVPDVLEERLDIADLNRIFDDHETAKDRNNYISKVSDKLHDRHHDTGKEL